MLSIKPFSSAGAAQNYYSHGDYYGSEGEGLWMGSGADALGLKGEFTAKNNKVFADLLSGKLPSGQQLGRRTANGIEHRPGIDMTFSCPKSFSLEMLVFANPERKKELEKALINAVEKTLSYVEKRGYAIVRKGEGGKDKEPIKELAFAAFPHTTNRNLEPQAHVHCFLANVAQCSDGKFRSLSYDKVLDNVKLLGQVFRNELAFEVKKLGYETDTKILSDGSSSFELSHIHPKLISAFSTRRKEIEALFKQYGVTTKEGRDNIVINSRKAKKSIEQETLMTVWSTLADKVKTEITVEEKPVKQEPTNKAVEAPVQATSLTVKDLALLCVDDVSYNKTVFTEEDLMRKVLKFSIGKFSTQKIHKEITKLTKSGILIRTEDGMTTKELLDKERQILKYTANGIGKASNIISGRHFENRCMKFEKREKAQNPKFEINDQQRAALKHILTSKDKIIAIEGLPGVGKSTVLNGVRDIANKKVISLLGFGEKFAGAAPTASAAKTLKESAKIDSATLHSFLYKYKGYIEDRGTKGSLNAQRKAYSNTVVFLDESSLVPTRMMWQLLKLADKFGFKLVVAGDTKQQGAVEAGKPFEQMLDVIKSIKLDKVVRQKDELHKEAVEASSLGDIKKTFAIHDANIKEERKASAIVKQAVRLYLEKDAKQRDQTLLISPTRKMRDSINNKIRVALRKDNALTGDIHSFTALKQKDMSNADHRFAPSFEKNDILRFNIGYKNGIEKGDYLRVLKTNEITNSLVLGKDDREIIYSLKKVVSHETKFEVFKEEKLQLQEGLKIKFTKNDKRLGLINSETAVIEKIGQDTMQLKLEDGSVKELPKSKLQHIDYGYCITIYAAQGKTYENTIAAISNNKLLNNQKSWLVTLSRHKNEFTALVENKNKLESYLISNTGAKVSAIELVTQHDLKKQSSSRTELEKSIKLQ